MDEIMEAFNRNTGFVTESLYACLDSGFLDEVDYGFYNVAGGEWQYGVSYDLLEEPYLVQNLSLSASVTMERQGDVGAPLEGHRILYRVSILDLSEKREIGHIVTNSYQYANSTWDLQDTSLQLHSPEGEPLTASIAFSRGREFVQDPTDNLRTYHDGVIAIINNAFPSPYAVLE